MNRRILQTILVPRTFTSAQANKWIRDHGYKTHHRGKSVDITDNYYRYRQSDPRHGRYFTVTLSNGIEMIYVNV